MEVYNKPGSGRASSSTTSSGCRFSGNDEDMSDVRRGPWTVDEDLILINHIANHGEGRWNSLARCAGLSRTGKSCRLRWLNYLRPDVRRGNITLEEQLLILELHSRWGNRWSKIAQHLPGRTDNEIKNYWRTRVQKHAKQLKCDINSRQFKDTMKYLWMPRLVERIQASAVVGNQTLPSVATSPEGSTITAGTAVYPQHHPENSCTTASSSEYSNPFYSEYPSNDYYPTPFATDPIQGSDIHQQGEGGHFPGGQQIMGPPGYYQYPHFDPRMDSQPIEHHHHHHHQQQQQHWTGTGDADADQSSDNNFWDNICEEEDINYWYLQNHHNLQP